MSEQFQYLAFFNLREPPFNLVPVPHIFFPSRRHLQIIDIIKFSILQGSLISVIVGEPGVGKTQALLTLLEGLPSDKYYKIQILNPALSPEDLLKSIFWQINATKFDEEERLEKPNLSALESNSSASSKIPNEFPMDLRLTKHQILKHLNDWLTELKVKKAKLLLVVDEAQLLLDETLEELRLITNLNEGTDPVLQILLIGQPPLRERLKSSNFLPLRQRISILEELKPLDKDEILAYIWFRINQVSERAELNFHKNILGILHKFTRGVPRIINKLMDRALFIAYTNEERLITKKHIKEAKATFDKIVIEVI